MKKYLLVLLSVLAIVALATTAFALHEVPSQEYTPSLVKASKAQLEFGGEIRIRGEVNDNLSDLRDTDNGDFSDHSSFYDERVTLNAKATVSPNTFGFIELQSGGNDADTFKWGQEDSSVTSGRKRGNMSIRQAYISTNLGKVATLKAGHMLLALGNNLFFDHTKFGDDAILFSIPVPAADGELSLITFKFDEDDTTQNDDLDGYVVAYGQPIGTSAISADFTYLRDHEKGNGHDGFYLWNVGARFNGDFGGIKVKVDGEFQDGKAKDSVFDLNGNVLNDDVDFGGYALMAGVEIPAGPAAVRVNAAYGSGDDIDTEDDYEGYVNFLSDNQYTTYLYDYKVVTAAGGKHTGISNTWYVNAGLTAKPTADLKLLADVYYLQAAREVSDASDFDSKDIGVEVDAKVEYQLDTNLVYFVEAGYLWAGDLYANVTGDDSEIDNPYSVRHGLLLKF